VNGGRWEQVKHMVMLGYQSFIFPDSRQVCSDSCYSIQQDFLSCGVLVFKATSECWL